MRVLGISLGVFSFVFAFIGAFLSAAPFTPAVFVVALTIPAAIAAILLGSKSVGWLALYWSGCAVLAFGTLQLDNPRGDWVLLLAYAIGFVLVGIQLYRYVKLKRVEGG